MRIILIILSFLIWSINFPSLADIGTSLDISRLIYSGRTMGMGGAHVALSDDGEGVFTNPSGLAGIEFPQASGLTRKILLEETIYSLYSLALPTKWGTFGVGYANARIAGSVPTMRDPGTNRIMIDPSGYASNYENGVIMLTYARQLPWRKISVGCNLKFFNQNINTIQLIDSATGTNLDLSASYKPLTYLNFGVNFQNILSNTVNWSKTSEKIGGYTKIGAALNLLGENTAEALYQYPQSVVACLDLDLPRDILSPIPLLHFGVEWSASKMLALRAGLNQQTSGTGLTFGVGLQSSAYRFDYAFAQILGVLGDNPHYFSISYVGDRVLSTKEKFKRAESDIKFINPKDRSLTTSELIPIKAELKGRKVYEHKNIWTVPIFETTSEVYEVQGPPVDLISGRYNDYPINQTGTVEVFTLLDLGRNAIKFSGYTRPEGALVSSEVRILRIIPYQDVPADYWAIEPITLSSILGLLKGYPDKRFKPEKGITRAELTALLVRTEKIDLERWQKVKKFTDVKDKWYVPYINFGAELGLVTGYPDKTFKPDKILNRAEGVAILSRFAKLIEKEGLAFPDLKLAFWANKYIQPAKDAGLLLFLESKDFEPAKPFTRSEAAEVLYRTEPIQKRVNVFWDYGIIK